MEQNRRAERIVVASDGGAASHTALDWVVDRGSRSPIEVEVVTVEETEWLPVGGDESEFRRKYIDILDEAGKHLANRPGVSLVAKTMLSGRPAEELAKVARLADELVIGSKLTGAAVGARRGTLALHLAPRTPCRLTVVPQNWAPRGGPIVVGVEDDESSTTAIEEAATEADRTGRALVLVHAWSLPAPFSIVEGLLNTTYPTLEAVHQQILDVAIARGKLIAPRSEISQVLKFGPPTEVLLEAAEHASLLVVGSHGRGMIGSLILGSVSHRALVAAPCPVAVVPPIPQHRGNGVLASVTRVR
jgi:nucleotide-binding universal stress UspA family protein